MFRISRDSCFLHNSDNICDTGMVFQDLENAVAHGVKKYLDFSVEKLVKEWETKGEKILENKTGSKIIFTGSDEDYLKLVSQINSLGKWEKFEPTILVIWHDLPTTCVRYYTFKGVIEMSWLMEINGRLIGDCGDKSVESLILKAQSGKQYWCEEADFVVTTGRIR